MYVLIIWFNRMSRFVSFVVKDIVYVYMEIVYLLGYIYMNIVFVGVWLIDLLFDG